LEAAEETVDEFVRRKLALLPEFLQKLLQVAACIGDDIDVCALAKLFADVKLSQIEFAVQVATAEGHLVYDSRNCISRFSHDRVRQAALSMVDGDRDAMSFSIGYRLWKNASAMFLSEKIFVISNLLNCGITSSVRTTTTTRMMDDQAERYRAASLNLEAGTKAASLAAFPDSCRYLAAGIEFMKGTNSNDY